MADHGLIDAFAGHVGKMVDIKIRNVWLVAVNLKVFVCVRVWPHTFCDACSPSFTHPS